MIRLAKIVLQTEEGPKVRKKLVFIAHPISGDVPGNIRKVLKICKVLHSKNIIPVVPYLVSLQYLNDDLLEDRALGIEANHECFHRGFVDELWLFGDRISAGMREEVLLALRYEIPIHAKTAQTQQALKILLAELAQPT